MRTGGLRRSGFNPPASPSEVWTATPDAHQSVWNPLLRAMLRATTAAPCRISHFSPASGAGAGIRTRRWRHPSPFHTYIHLLLPTFASCRDAAPPTRATVHQGRLDRVEKIARAHFHVLMCFSPPTVLSLPPTRLFLTLPLSLCSARARSHRIRRAGAVRGAPPPHVHRPSANRGFARSDEPAVYMSTGTPPSAASVRKTLQATPGARAALACLRAKSKSGGDAPSARRSMPA